MKAFLEALTRTELLQFQTFLVDNLPSYVDVGLNEDGLVLTGDFDPIYARFDDRALVITTKYGVKLTTQLGERWTPKQLAKGDLRPFLMALNLNVGLRKITKWLEAEGFKKAVSRFEADEPQRWAYEKLLPNNGRVQVAFDSGLHEDSAYVIVGLNDSMFSLRNVRHRFSPSTLKRFQHAVELAIDDYEATGLIHNELGTRQEDISHLELKRES